LLAEKEKQIADKQQLVTARDLAITDKNKIITELRDVVRSEQAEMENVRTRAKEDVKKGAAFALQKFAKDLLEPLDTMALAIGQISKDLTQHPELQSSVEGIDLIQKTLLKTLEKHGIRKVSCDSFHCAHSPVVASLKPRARSSIPTSTMASSNMMMTAKNPAQLAKYCDSMMPMQFRYFAAGDEAWLHASRSRVAACDCRHHPRSSVLCHCACV